MGNTSCKKGHIIEKGCPKQHDSTRSQTAVAEVLELVDPIAPGLGEGMSHELVRSARTIGLVFARKIYRKAMVFTIKYINIGVSGFNTLNNSVEGGHVAPDDRGQCKQCNTNCCNTQFRS